MTECTFCLLDHHQHHYHHDHSHHCYHYHSAPHPLLELTTLVFFSLLGEYVSTAPRASDQ